MRLSGKYCAVWSDAASRMFWAALACGLLCFPAFASFVPHQAVYAISLERNAQSSSIESVSGRTAFQIEDGCDSWSSIEDYAIIFGFAEGQESRFISHYETWEAKDGSGFSFKVEEFSTMEGEQVYEGFVNADGGKAEAYFADGTDTVVALPEDTLFPILHLAKLLEAAAAGETVRQSSLFLGGDAEDALYLTNSLVGKPRQVAADSRIQALVPDALQEQRYWPMRIAFFKADSVAAEPEYEIDYEIQDNGLIRSYIVDYGSFSMRAELQKVKLLQAPVCS